MRNKKIFFISILIFMVVLGVSAVSAADSNDTVSAADEEISLEDSQQNSGTVSGDVVVESENPWNTSGQLDYDIPADAKTIKSADVYVNVYGGSAKNTYGANANVTINYGNGVLIESESLWIEEGSADGTIYTVNNHTTKCYSDYMIHYDITDLLQGLNGTHLKINVDTFKMENKTFDGRIKLIGLVLAYDDGDSDVINYWINDTQIWTNSQTTLTFDTTSLTDVLELSLTNIALSSSDATYKINNEFLTDAEHKSGNYYQYNRWDVTDYFNSTRQTEFTAIGSAGSYGVSYKNVLSVLKAVKGEIDTSVSLASERNNGGLDIIYAGTYNQFTINVNTNKHGKYAVRLLADGVVVNSTEVFLTGPQVLKLIDNTVRPVDASTVSTGATGSYSTVNYTVELLLKDEVVDNATIKTSVLYNGYLPKDLSYPGNDFASFLNATITGDIVINVSSQAYASGSANRVDTWNVVLPDNSSFVKAFVYVAYCYGTADDQNLFNVTFNSQVPAVVSFTRDQANILSVSGYGLIVYDVTDFIKAGENTFNLNKIAGHNAGAYPSTLIYLYNTTGSNVVKNVYISNGADLVGMTGNGANRTIQVDTVLTADSSVADGALLYVIGAGCKDDRASIIVNGERDDNVWNTAADANQINIYTKDISKTLKDANNVSIILNHDMFTAFQQIIVTSTVVNPTATVSLASERNNGGLDIVYAGTYNQISVTVNTDKHGVYTVKLLADGVEVNSTNVSLAVGSTKVDLIDNTIRPVDASTVSTGKAAGPYTKVNYTAVLLLNNEVVESANISAGVLYNGYLPKDLSYPGNDFASFLNATITGDIVINVSSQAYASGSANRVDTWNVVLPDNSSFVKAFVYVAYCYGTADDQNLFNVTFNSQVPAVVSFTRDQANILSVSGYGLIVYDVTDFIKAGENTFNLNKIAGHNAGAYPSTLIYLYNTTGSNVVKNVYISNGADLVGMTGNGAKRPIQIDTVLNIDASQITGAVAYIFGAGCKDDRASIIINGERDDNVWNTAADANQINIYTKDISATVKDSNDVSIVLNHDMFTAFQQIIVTTQKTPTKITAPSVTTVYNTNKNLVVTLKDVNGNAIANAKVTVNLNGKSKDLTTDAKGQAKYAIPSNLVPKNYYKATVSYAGDNTHVKSVATAKVIVKKANVKLTTPKKTYKAKVKTKKYTVTLKNNKGKVMKKVKLTLKVKGKTFKATTNSKGKATFKITNLKKKGKYTAKVTYKGDKYYNKKVNSVKITVKK